MTANGASLMRALFAGIVFIALGMLAVRVFPIPFSSPLVLVGKFSVLLDLS